MKKVSLLFIAIATFLFTAVRAQVVLDRADFGNIGDLMYYEADTTLSTSFTTGSAGADVSWDFSSSVSSDMYDSVIFMDPAMINNAPEGADVAIVQGGQIQFVKINDDGVKVIIPLAAYFGSDEQVRLTNLPFGYGDSLKDSVIRYITRTPEDFGFDDLPFDSIRITVKVVIASLADGWGSLKTPVETHEVLRVKNSISVKLTVEGKLPFIHLWIAIPFPIDLNEDRKTYAWYGKNQKYSLAEATMDSNGNVSTFRYRVSSPVTGTKNISATNIYGSYPNPVNDLLTVRYQSETNAMATIEIFDITGKMISAEKAQAVNGINTFEVSAQSLPEGMYTARIISAGKQGITRFIVKH